MRLRRHVRLGAVLGAALFAIAVTGAAAAQTPPPQPPPSGPRPPISQPPPTLRQPILPPPTTLPAAPTDSGGSSPMLPVLAVLAAAGLIGGTVVIVSKRNAAGAAVGERPVMPPSTPTADASPRPSALTDELLDVSRRLTAAAVTGDVTRAIVRGALSLIPADGAALVLVAPDGALTVGAETHHDLVVAEHLADGLIGRVAETGQHVAQVSATEPSLRSLPAALLAVPFVGGGRVEAVLVVLRAQDHPFTTAETRVLQSLAPMGAAALHNERQGQQAIEASLVDGLTGLGNRRRFDTDLAAALRAGPTSLIIVDLDHFKSVNDKHGHPAGDAVLRSLAVIIRDALRPGDAAYRYGGEEFCVLLRATAPGEAVDVAERIRSAIESHAFDIGAGDPLQATASLGVAECVAGDGPAEVTQRADAALYESKHGGRNRVTAAA